MMRIDRATATVGSCNGATGDRTTMGRRNHRTAGSAPGFQTRREAQSTDALRREP